MDASDVMTCVRTAMNLASCVQVNLFAPQTTNPAHGVVRALATDASDVARTNASLSFIDSDGQVTGPANDAAKELVAISATDFDAQDLTFTKEAAAVAVCRTLLHGAKFRMLEFAGQQHIGQRRKRRLQFGDPVASVCQTSSNFLNHRLAMHWGAT